MKTQEWEFIDRSGWPAGAWDSEPDKAQWQDSATGLPCMAHRNRWGAWCGYVGVAMGHPYHGVDYAKIVDDIGAHGGFSYSDHCEQPDDDGRGICHIPDPGEPDCVWWLGFDCAHGCDLVPASGWIASGPGAQYRTLAYVRNHCASLAAQLFEVAQ